MGEKYRLKLTQLTYDDIDRVLGYISRNLRNPDAAADLYDAIEEKLGEITIFPYSYPDCQYYFITDTDYRHAVVGNYILFFRVVKEKKTVEILRFLYSRMDFSVLQIKPED